MPRLNLNLARTIGQKKTYIGNVLIFCEGTTEYNYIYYFASIINK